MQNLLKDMNDKNAALHMRIQELEATNGNIVSRYNNLVTEYQNQQSRPQLYNPTVPMTETSYDAPDPNVVTDTSSTPRQRRKEIVAYMNQPRETVADVYEKQKDENDTKNKDDDNKIMDEIADYTKAKQEIVDQPNDDPEVNNILGLISSQ